MPRKKTTKKKTEAGVVVLENFHQQTIISREVEPNSEFMHRFILSPTYLFKYADNPTLDDYGDVSYPLYANLPSTTLSLTSGIGYITAYCSPSNANDSRIVYVATSKGKVLALSKTGIARDFGTPASLSASQDETTLARYSGKLFFINPSQTSLYYIDETSTGTTWSTITGLISPKFGETYSTNFYVADKSSSSNNYRNLIKVYGTGLSQLGQLDLGAGLDIQDIVNNNNRLMVLIANPANVFTEQYMFLWDGMYSNRPFHVLRLPGIYLGSINYSGAFFIFLKQGNAVYVYELAGYALRMIDIFPQTDVLTKLNPAYRFSTYGNYMFFPAYNKNDNFSFIAIYNIFEKYGSICRRLFNKTNLCSKSSIRP
jgi:hypothetical protein